MSAELIEVPSVELISQRLHFIFPEGTENRVYLIRNISASSIFVMFYVGAVSNIETWIRPDQVTKMTNKQAKQLDSASRLRWAAESLAPGKMKNVLDRWYSGNTRESIRDETLRSLLDVGAVEEKEGVPTTSSKPRYQLASDFAELFDVKLLGKAFAEKILEWRKNNLTQSALARLKLLKYSATSHSSMILVKFPDGETRKMAPGPSSLLSKAAIEQFANNFLKKPAIVFLSESKNKVVSRDDALAKSIGLRIQADKNLPDIIIADVGPKHPLIVFVEIVSTDGPVTRKRKEALLKIAVGFKPEQVAFLTVFNDRSDPAFKKASSELAWGSFVWFASEPDCLINLLDKTKIKGKTISDILQ